MSIDVSELESLSVAELVALVKQLLQRVEALDAEKASLKENLRGSTCAARPFSRGGLKPDSKELGRRVGEGRV